MSATTFVCSIIVFLFGALVGSLAMSKLDALHTDKLMASICASSGAPEGSLWWRNRVYICTKEKR